MTLKMENQLDKLSNIMKCMQKCLECAICLETLTVPVQTRCGHLFCKSCIMTVAIKKGAMCPLCKQPISRRTISINTQVKELSTGFKALSDAIQADTRIDIRNRASKPGNGREGIQTPCKSNILIERKKMRMNARKSRLLRNVKENRAAAEPINLNESAKPMKDSENVQNNIYLESSNGHDVDHENENKNFNLASIKYMETLKSIDRTHETAPREKVAAWLECMEWGEELETIETKNNTERNTDMPSKRCLPCATDTLEELNIEGSPCESNIDKMTSAENKILSLSCAEGAEQSVKTNKLLTVTTDVMDGAVKALGRESNVMSKKISEMRPYKLDNENLKYKGIHLRAQEINKKVLNTSVNDNWSRVMQFGNHNNIVRRTLSSSNSANTHRMSKNTLSKPKNTVSEDTEENNVVGGVSSLNSSDRHSLSGNMDGSTVIMSNVSYTPIVSRDADNTTSRLLSKTNVNDNRGLHLLEETTSELRVMSPANSYNNQCEVSATKNDQRIDPDHKMHNNSLTQQRLQSVSKDIESVSTKDITAKEAYVNKSDVSNQAMPLLSPLPNFTQQLVRHFGSPNHIDRGQQRKYNSTLQNVTPSPPKLTPVKGRSLLQQMDLNDAKNKSHEFLVQNNSSTLPSSIPNFRNKLYQKGILHASRNPDISKNVKASSTSTAHVSANSRETINSVVNLEYAEMVGKCKHSNAKSSSYSTKNETISSQKFKDKLKSKRITTQQQNENNTIKKCHKNIQFFYMGHINSGMLKAKIKPFNDITIQNGTITHNRYVQTPVKMSDLNTIEELKLIIEKQRLTMEEQRLIMAKQELTIKKQETMINRQKPTIKEQEPTITERDFSEKNVEFSNKPLNSQNQIPVQASSVLLKVGTTKNELFGQNETHNKNSSPSTSTNMKSINVNFQSQSILNNSDSENQRDNSYIEQKKNVRGTKNISGNGSTSFIDSQKRQNCSTGMCCDSEKNIKECGVKETLSKNTKVRHSYSSCHSQKTKQSVEELNPDAAICTKNNPNTSKKDSKSQGSKLTYKRIIVNDSPDVDSDPLEVSLPSKNSVGIETSSKSYINFKSEKILKKNFNDVVTSHEERSSIDGKRSMSSLIHDDTNGDAIMNDWCSSSKLSGFNNQENNNSNRNTVNNIISKNIKQMGRSIDMAWKNTKMCQVDVVNVDTCNDRDTSLLINKRNISKPTYIGFDDKFTPKTDESCEEVRTRKRKLRETEDCVNAKDVKERFCNVMVTKVRRIENDFIKPEKDVNRCEEVTPTENIISLDLVKSGATNVEQVIDNGKLLSNKITSNVMSDKDQITDYQSQGKIDTQDRMAMEDNFNEAMANVDTQLLAGLTIEGQQQQSTPLKTNPACETNLLKSCQSTNTSLDSKDTIQRDSSTSSKPDQTKLHIDSSMKSVSKKFKEFFNLSQFSNNLNKENCNVNVTQDKVLSTKEHNLMFQKESRHQRLLPSKLKSNRMKAQHACNTSTKTVEHNNIVCIEANSSTAYKFEEKNISDKNLIEEKTSGRQSVTSPSMDNQDKGIYDGLFDESNICERDSLMNIAEEMMISKNTEDELFGKSKSKVVRTSTVEDMKSQNAVTNTRRLVMEHTPNTKNCSSADFCNKDYDISYSDDDVVEKTPENKLKVNPHAPNTRSQKSCWMSLNLTPIPKIMEKPSIATPSMNCAAEQSVVLYGNTVSAYGSKVLETPKRDKGLFMLYESTPKISHTTRNSWIVPEACLRERKCKLNISTAGTSTCAKSQMRKSKSKLCFLCTTLSTEQIKNVQRFAKLVDAEFTTVFRPEVTHVILVADSENNSIPRTLKYLQAVVHKKWVVSYSWVLDSLKQGTLLDEEKYEPMGVSSSEPASRKSRLDNGTLFEGFAFLCIGPFQGATVENYEDLVRCTGGYVVQTLDALAASNHQWKFIIIPDVIHDNELIGWYQRTKAVPVLNDWLLECICQYTLISLHSFIRELTPQDLLKLGFPLELVESDESDVSNDASP